MWDSQSANLIKLAEVGANENNAKKRARQDDSYDVYDKENTSASNSKKRNHRKCELCKK